MGGALDDIDYLTRSEHRVRLLRQIAARPRSREELESAVGVSTVSLVRNLRGLEDRQWIASSGRQYRITPWGRMIVNDFDALIETAKTTRKLSRAIEDTSFDRSAPEMRWFRDSTVTLAETADALQPVRRWEEVTDDESVGDLRIALGSVIPRTIRKAYNEGRNQNRDCELVFDQNVMGFISENAGLRSWLLDVLDAGHDIYRYDGGLEYNLAIADSIVLLGFDHEEGGPKAVIESTNERVLGWVEETFERYRCEAVPIGPNALSVG